MDTRELDRLESIARQLEPSAAQRMAWSAQTAQFVSDLIEALRPAADEWVWQQFRGRTVRDDHFTLDRGACLLGKAGRSAFYGAWKTEAFRHQRWLRRLARRTARALHTEGLDWVEDVDVAQSAADRAPVLT